MDTAIRDLERALAAGDEAIRPVLAAAYLREGRSGEALDLIDAPPLPSADLLRLSALGWERELKRLRPAGRVPGTRAYPMLFGWLPGRRAVILSRRGGGNLQGIYDLTDGNVVLERCPRTPCAISEAAVFFDHPMLEGSAVWRDGEGVQELPQDGFVRSAHADGEYVVVASHRQFRRDGAHAVRRLDDDLFTWVGAPWAIDWERDLVAWYPARGPLYVGNFARDASRAIEVPQDRRSPHLFGFLDDGRLLIGGPQALRLIDVELGIVSGEVRLPWADALSGAVSLSRDSEALLALRMGIPYRIALDGSPPRPFANPPPPKVGLACWHPRADVVALGVGPAGTELRAPENRVVLRLPHDARPLGWTPDGRGLLVVRQTHASNGFLELWTPGGAL